MADEFSYENIITINYKIIKIRTKSNTPELFINMIFLTGFNAICIEIRGMYRFSEIGNVSLDFRKHAQIAFIEKGMIFHVMYTLRLCGEKSEYDCLHG